MTDNASMSSALRALTAAALALPGMTPANAQDGPQLNLQYGHYAEGERNLDGQSYSALGLKPIEVDSFALQSVIPLTDRLNLNANFTQDSWSGATPVASLPSAAVQTQILSGASSPNFFEIDRQGTPYVVDFNDYDPDSDTYAAYPHPGLVHVMAQASPETRRQWDGGASYEWNRAELTVGGGISDEHDFLSRFVNASGTVNFNNKLTVVNWGVSAAFDRIRAAIAANSAADAGNYAGQIHDVDGQPTIFGHRADVAANIGVTQILDTSALIQADLGYTRSSGFLENPYKAVIFAFNDPDVPFDDQGLKYIPIKGSLEQRPDVRNQWAVNIRLAQHIAATDAALHLRYRFYRDSWKIHSQTIELSLDQPLGHGWMLTPDIRYYTQSAAFFYAPYFTFDEPFPAHPGGPLERDKIPINYFSSDERLSAFGALTGSLSLQKTLGHGVALDVSYEYYTHKGGLKLGGGGEPSYANFNSRLFTAGLSMDLERREAELSSRQAGGSPPSTAALLTMRPPGLMLPDITTAGTLALDAQFSGTSFKGPLEFNGHALTPADVTLKSCGAVLCRLAPISGGRNDLEFDLSYALTPRLAFTVSPRYVERSLTLVDAEPVYFIGPIGGPSGAGRHSTSGWGDTSLLASYELTSSPHAHVRLGAGLSAPTGDAGLKLNGKTDFVSYSLETGSGTWDALGALDIEGDSGPASAGLELSATRRFGTNAYGYRLGNEVRADFWAGIDALPWLNLAARVHYDEQGRIHGQYEDHLEHGSEVPHVIASADDLPGNHGGGEIECGANVNVHASAGPLKGDRLSVEWLQPVSSGLNGYQLRRGGTVNAKVTIPI